MNESVPGHWAPCSLADIADIRQGQSPPSSSYVSVGTEGAVPFLQGNAEFGDTTPVPGKATTASRVIASRGSVLLSVRAPVGDTNIADADVAIGRGLSEIRPAGGIDPRFIFWLLRAKRSELEKQATGTTFSAVTGRVVKELPVLLPPIGEQEAIVETIERLFASLDEASRELREAERLARFFDVSILMGAVGEHSRVSLGSVVSGMKYGTSVKCSYDASGPPVLRIPNVREGRIDTTDLKFATVSKAELGDAFLRPGDLLFVRTNGSRDLIGRVAAVDEPTESAYASYLIRARPDPGRLDPAFAVAVLSSLSARAEIEAKAASTAGQYNLNIPSLKSLMIPLPPLEEQRQIAAVASERREAAAMAVAEVARAQGEVTQLRNAILFRAFGGRLLPSGHGDATGQALLAEIRMARAAADKPLPRSRAKKARAVVGEA